MTFYPEAQRILDSAARRLLREQVNGDSLSPTASLGDGGRLDHGLNQPTPLRHRQEVPVIRPNRQSRVEAA